jgi:periplasmic protein TonB
MANFILTEWVFEGRNKAYGAYQLRKNYAKALWIGVFVSLFLVFGVILVLYFQNKSKEEAKEQVIYIDLENFTPTKDQTLIEPPKKQPPKQESPKIKQESSPNTQKVKNNTPEIVPKIQKDTAKNSQSSLKKDSLRANKPKAQDSLLIARDTTELKPFDSLDAFKTYLTEERKYPKQAVLEQTECVVAVIFYVNEDGSLTIRHINGCEDYFEEEVRRLFAKSPRWIPILKDDKAIRKLYKVDIKFKLSDLK